MRTADELFLSARKKLLQCLAGMGKRLTGKRKKNNMKDKLF
jgi:hypothetical protein